MRLLTYLHTYTPNRQCNYFFDLFFFFKTYIFHLVTNVKIDNILYIVICLKRFVLYTISKEHWYKIQTKLKYII